MELWKNVALVALIAGGVVGVYLWSARTESPISGSLPDAQLSEARHAGTSLGRINPAVGATSPERGGTERGKMAPVDWLWTCHATCVTCDSASVHDHEAAREPER